MKHLVNGIRLLGQEDMDDDAFELSQDKYTLEDLQNSIATSEKAFRKNTEWMENEYEIAVTAQSEHFTKVLNEVNSQMATAKQLEAAGTMTYRVKRTLEDLIDHLEEWVAYPKDCYEALSIANSNYEPMLKQANKLKRKGQEAFGLIAQLAKALNMDRVEMEIDANNADPSSPEAETFICTGEVEVLDYNESTLTVDIDWWNYEAERMADPLTYILQGDYLIRNGSNVRIPVDNLSQAVSDIEEDLITEAYIY